MRLFFRLLYLATCLPLTSLVTLAEADRDKQTVITSEALECVDQEDDKCFKFTGNVVVTGRNFRTTCDSLIVTSRRVPASTAAIPLCAVATASGRPNQTAASPSESCAAKANHIAMQAPRMAGLLKVRQYPEVTNNSTSAAVMAPRRWTKCIATRAGASSMPNS